MSGPADGKYRIQLAIDPKPFIGVDPAPVVVLPVITDGSDNVWTVSKLPDGNYNLTLGQSGFPLFIRDDDGRLVGSGIPPPSTWSIRRQDGGSYTVEVPSNFFPSRGWTVNNPGPKSPVTIKFFEIPLPYQLWNFIPSD